MPYSLEFRGDTLTYLRHCPVLSREGRNTLFATIDRDLRQHGDVMRGDPVLRLEEGSEFFIYAPLIRDPSDHQMVHFRFIVNDSSAAVGVLRIEFIDQWSA